MREKPASASQPSHELILVLEPDEEIGDTIVHLIRRETPYRALLATTPRQAHRMLQQLTGDVVVLADEVFSPEDLEDVSFLPGEGKPQAAHNRPLLSSTYHSQNAYDMKNVVKAMNLLLRVRNAP